MCLINVRGAHRSYFLTMLMLPVAICYCVYCFFVIGVFISVFLTGTIVGTLLCVVFAESDAPLFLSMILGVMFGLVAAEFYRIATTRSISIDGIYCGVALSLVASIKL